MLKTKVEKQEDLNPQETAEWLEALEQIIDEAGPNRASYLLDRLVERGRLSGAQPTLRFNTPYLNTIPKEREEPYPGDREIERRIKSIIRWNAMAMVVRANKYDPGIGGHISTYASLATLLEVGFNHFFRGSYGDETGDLVYFQGGRGRVTKSRNSARHVRACRQGWEDGPHGARGWGRRSAWRVVDCLLSRRLRPRGWSRAKGRLGYRL